MPSPKSSLDPDKYARLRAEAKAPYRPLRKFVYLSFGISGLLGAFIFIVQIAAQRDVAETLPNLGVQIAVVALMVVLFRWDNKKN
jgi:Low psii accumulation1 / Rep27